MSQRERERERELSIRTNKDKEVLKIDTLSQLADPFTKAMTITVFKQHASDIGILPSLDA